MGRLAELLDTGALRPAIEATYELADTATAHARAAQGHLQGKIVITIAGREA
jgi:NADPH:quinone reductase-like Zn-dependent oxidoreductase